MFSNQETKDGVSMTLCEADNLTIGIKQKLTLKKIHHFAYSNINVSLSPESYEAMESSYRFLKFYVDQRIPIYGLNTNFGDQANLIDPYLNDDNEDLYHQSIRERQQNIIRSLACSLGNEIPPQTIRATMMLRAHCLAQGYSGVSTATVESLLAHLNAGITPIIGCYGSIGASGDLIPLASISSSLIGENVKVKYNNEVMSASQAIKLAGLRALEPEFRDGIALINGTSLMTAIAGLALHRLNRLFKQLLSAVAMALESMLVISSAYHPLVHQLKHHIGACTVNEYLLNFWEGSQLLTNLDELRKDSINHSTRSVQDYYSLRSVSQGFGPMYDNLQTAIIRVENEMNSVNDNPIIDVANHKIHHGANFMGYYITSTCDILKMDIAQASTWIHALLSNLLHPRKNQNLPTNLVDNPEKNNGFRATQLLAAALAVQNRKLAASHQSFMLPTEGDNQDVNSLGTHAALDLQEASLNLERLNAILLLAATQAIEFRGIENASKKSQQIYQIIRAHSPKLVHCHPMSDEITDIINLLEQEKI